MAGLFHRIFSFRPEGNCHPLSRCIIAGCYNPVADCNFPAYNFVTIAVYINPLQVSYQPGTLLRLHHGHHVGGLIPFGSHPDYCVGYYFYLQIYIIIVPYRRDSAADVPRNCPLFYRAVIFSFRTSRLHWEYALLTLPATLTVFHWQTASRPPKEAPT